MVACCFTSSGKTFLRAKNINFLSDIPTERIPNCLILIEVHTLCFAVAFFQDLLGVLRQVDACLAMDSVRLNVYSLLLLSANVIDGVTTPQASILLCKKPLLISVCVAKIKLSH